MSAGELESGNAGEPAKLIRQRYREASDIIKKGKMCAPRSRAPNGFSEITLQAPAGCHSA